MYSLVPSNDPRLRQSCRAVTSEEIRSGTFAPLIEAMKAYLTPDKGVGIAASQLGETVRIIAIQDTFEHMRHVTEERRRLIGRHPIPLTVLYNPIITIIDREDLHRFYPEGCLSTPDTLGVVKRSDRIGVNALNSEGRSLSFEARSWFARIIQHEVDHLDGISFLDRALPKSIMPVEEFIARWSGKTSDEYREAFI